MLIEKRIENEKGDHSGQCRGGRDSCNVLQLPGVRGSLEKRRKRHPYAYGIQIQ